MAAVLRFVCGKRLCTNVGGLLGGAVDLVQFGAALRALLSAIPMATLNMPCALCRLVLRIHRDGGLAVDKDWNGVVAIGIAAENLANGAEGEAGSCDGGRVAIGF